MTISLLMQVLALFSVFCFFIGADVVFAATMEFVPSVAEPPVLTQIQVLNEYRASASFRILVPDDFGPYEAGSPFAGTRNSLFDQTLRFSFPCAR